MVDIYLIQPPGISYVPFVVAFCGCSGSGKSTAARKIAERFRQRGISAIEYTLDDYYRDQGHLPPEERDRLNYDNGETCDIELGDRHLGELIKGNTIQRPCYDFTTHTRLKNTVPVYPAQVIAADSIFAFKLYNVHFRIFVDTPTGPELTPDNLCLPRRIGRDMEKRGRTRESVERQWKEQVYPMHAQYRPEIINWAQHTAPWAHPEEENDATADRLFEVVFAEYQKFQQKYQRGSEAWPVIPRLGFVP